MNPKVGEYWYISTVARISWDGSPTFTHETYIILAKYISNNMFVGPKLQGFGNTSYGGRNGYSYELLHRWEPNWFWKLLGYR